MSYYRKQAAAAVGKIINAAPYIMPVRELRQLLRERGPQDIRSAKFRIWHGEARKHLKAWEQRKHSVKAGNTLL